MTETIYLDGRDWLTVADAALLAQVEVDTIYKSVERGRLTSRKLLSTLKVVPLDEVLALWPQAEAEEPVA